MISAITGTRPFGNNNKIKILCSYIYNYRHSKLLFVAIRHSTSTTTTTTTTTGSRFFIKTIDNSFTNNNQISITDFLSKSGINKLNHGIIIEPKTETIIPIHNGNLQLQYKSHVNLSSNDASVTSLQSIVCGFHGGPSVSKEDELWNFII